MYRILIVEDDDEISALLRDELERCGYESVRGQGYLLRPFPGSPTA